MVRPRSLALANVLAALLSCGGRQLPVAADDVADAPSESGATGAEADPLAFCSGPPKVFFNSFDAGVPERISAHWTIISGPAHPDGGGVPTYTRVWVFLYKGSSWDWANESGIGINGTIQPPVTVDLANLPSKAWSAWAEHGLGMTAPDAEKPFSTGRGHRFEGRLELRGSMHDGAEVSICMVATRPKDDGTTETLRVHAANVPIPPPGERD